MKIIQFQVDDERARELRITLADWLKRETGKDIREGIELNQLVKLAISQIVINELSDQLLEQISES